MTESGTRGFMRRESSCWVGGIMSVLGLLLLFSLSLFLFSAAEVEVPFRFSNSCQLGVEHAVQVFGGLLVSP